MFLLLSSLPFLYSCDKLKGDVGPAGPQGETGIQGPKGDKGDPGTAAGGSGAIQLSTDTISTDADGNLSFSIPLTKETIASVEKGVVLIYAKSENLWFPLPGIVVFGKEASTFTYAYGINDVNIEVLIIQTSETVVKRKFQNIRVVVVPASNGRLSADVDYKKYPEVQKAFNLPE